MKPIDPNMAPHDAQRDSVTLTYEQTEEDLLAMLLFISERQGQTGWKAVRRGWPNLLKAFGWLFVPLTLLMNGLSWPLGKAALFAAIVSGSFVAAASLIAVPSVHRWLKRRAARRLARTCGNILLGHIQLAVDSTGLGSRGPAGQTQRNWAHFESVGITASHVFLVINNLTMYAIPRRAFRSDNAFQTFHQLVAGYLAAAKSTPAPQRRLAGASTFADIPVGNMADYSAEVSQAPAANPYAAPRTDGNLPPYWPAGPLPLGQRVTIDYEDTVDDVVAAAIFQEVRMQSWHRRVVRVLRDMLVVIVLSFPLVSTLGALQGAARPEIFVVSSACCAVFVAGIMVFIPRSRRKVIRRNTLKWLAETTTEMLGPTRMTIGPSGVTITKQTRQTHHAWNNTDRVAATKTYAFLIQGKLILYRIPRRAFPSDADFEKFIDLLRRYIQAAQSEPASADVQCTP